MDSDSSYRDPSRHRTQLFQALNGLTPPEFGKLLYGIQPPAGLIPDAEAPQMKRVKALLDWAEGSTGRGTDEIWDALAHLQQGPFLTQEPTHRDFQPYLQSITTQYEKWWEYYTLTDATDTMQRPISANPTTSGPPLVLDLHLNAQLFEPMDPKERIGSKKSGDFGQRADLKKPGNSEQQADPNKAAKAGQKADPKSEPDPSQDLRREGTPISVLNGIRKYANDHVLLVGRPGSGKSTALIRLLLEEATTYASRYSGGDTPASDPLGEGHIPVLVELRYWQGSIEGLIQSFLQRHGLILNSGALSDLLSKGQLILLIDGLNELPSEDARTQLSAFRLNHPKVPMVFTTRDLSLGGDLGIAKRLEMLPLSEGQMKAFIRAYVSDQAEVMLKQLNYRLREFGQTPLLLLMLCEVFRVSGQQLPNNLGEVFRNFTQSYEAKAERLYEVGLMKGDVQPLSDRNLWKKALMALAMRMMQGKTPVDVQVVISRTEAEQELKRIFAQEGYPVHNILDDLLKYHLLQSRASGDLEFRHQLIQEYYAAEALLQELPQLSNQHLKRNYLNLLKWTESVALMLALVKEEDQALRVVELAMDEVDLLLGAKLVGEINPRWQATAVARIDQKCLSIYRYLPIQKPLPIRLKIDCWAASRSEVAVNRLLQLIHTPNWDVCKWAAAALGNIGGKKAVEGLIRLLDDPDWDVRRNAASALGNIGSERAVKALIKLLDDPASTVRNNAVLALGSIGSERAVEDLIKFLHNPAWDRRRNAAIALGLIGSNEAVTELFYALRYPDMSNVAAEALCNIGSNRARMALMAARQDAFSEEMRMAAASALRGLGIVDKGAGSSNVKDAISVGELGDKTAVPALIKALKDREYWARNNAAEALGEIGDKTAVPALIEALKDQKYWVRRSAAVALGKLGDKTAVPALIEALKDHESWVCRSAAEALGELGDKTAVPVLIEALKDKDNDIQGSAAEALGELGDKTAVPVLIEALKDHKSWVRRSAAEALGELGDKTAVPALIEALKDKDNYIQESAALALVKLGNKSTISTLASISKSSYQSPYKRIETLSMLGNFDENKTILGWRLLLKDPDVYVRIRAMLELGKIGDRKAVLRLIRVLDKSVENESIRAEAAAALGNLGDARLLVRLWQLGCQYDESEIWDAIVKIQSRCKFYNYKIWKEAVANQNMAKEVKWLRQAIFSLIP